MSKLEITSAARVRRRRERMRASGLRPLQIWVPDTRAPGFAGECARQALVIRQVEAAAEQADAEAWEGVSDETGWSG